MAEHRRRKCRASGFALGSAKVNVVAEALRPLRAVGIRRTRRDKEEEEK